MWFRKRRPIPDSDEREAEIQAIRADLYKKIDAATNSTAKLNRLIDERRDTTWLMFLAMGGERRNGKR